MKATILRIDSGKRMSQAAVSGNLVFTAGRVAENSAGKDVGTQTREILAGLDMLLATAGTDKSKLVSVTIYLANMIDFDAMNKVYDAWIDKANLPVRACVEAGLAGSEFNVEIAVVAER
jgi:enamine deaminase RidA (YjgF/YER057c/UK114 family)